MGPVSRAQARAPRTAPRHRQGGVAAIFAAVSLVTLLSAVALSIDIGRLYFADRNLQRLADLAAIDAARVQSQCLGVADVDAVAAEVAASLQRNGMPTGTNVISRLGRRNKNGSDGVQTFTPSSPGQLDDAVQVTLSRPSPARILPLFAGDDSRTLTARAAASSVLVKSVRIETVPTGTGSLKPAFFGGALRANLALGGNGGGLLSGAEASVSLDRLVNVSAETSTDLPDLTVPESATGLLSRLEAQLNEAGDAAAATLVAAFSAAVETGRPGVEVLPSEVLGLPVQGSYDGATANVGSVLDAIAGAVSQGDVIQLPNLCALLPLDELPTAQLLPNLCDTTGEATLPQPSRLSTTNTPTQVLDLDTSNEGASTASALVRVRLKIANPLTGEPLTLPVDMEARGAKAVITEVACARAGVPAHVATVEARSPIVRFAIGNSNSFNASFTSPTATVGSLLDDSEPATLLTASLRDVLTAAGLGAVANNPLFSGLVGQTVTVTAGLDPFDVGTGEEATLCMEGGSQEERKQCNGQPALIGGVSPQQSADIVEQALGTVRLSVQLPTAVTGLPIIGAAANAAAAELLTDLNAALVPALNLLSPQLIRIAEASNVSVGQSQVVLGSVTVSAPKVFAR